MESQVCRDCPSRDDCETACPELLAIINEETIEWQETPRTLYKNRQPLRIYREPYKKQFFTPMEAEIAKLLLKFKTAKQIAEVLGISVENVYWHTHNLRKKLLEILHI